MTSIKRIIAVTGPTGNQGSSVISFLLKDGTFDVRAVTTNATSLKAQALVSLGVEVVQADFTDVESVKKAFDGVYGVFGLTMCWAPGVGLEGEIKQGKILVDAAKAIGVKHFIYSTLGYEDTEVPHWASKRAVNQYLIASGLPRTSLYTSFYHENFSKAGYYQITKADDGKYTAHWPLLASDRYLGCYCVSDTGGWVLEALKKPQEYIGRDVFCITEIYTPRQFIEAVEKAAGVHIDYHETSTEEFGKMKDVDWAKMLWMNMDATNQVQGKVYGDSAFEASRKVYPGTSMKIWVEENIDSILPQ